MVLDNLKSLFSLIWQIRSIEFLGAPFYENGVFWIFKLKKTQHFLKDRIVKKKLKLIFSFFLSNKIHEEVLSDIEFLGAPFIKNGAFWMHFLMDSSV